jgi:hypothetical protein
MSEKQNLSSLIWGTADDVLRGMFKPSEYRIYHGVFFRSVLI